MDSHTLLAAAFVLLLMMAGGVAGRIIWNHTHRHLLERKNPNYNFSVDWVVSLIIFTGLIWGGAQIKLAIKADDVTKVLAACGLLLSTYLVGWRPKWFWKW